MIFSATTRRGILSTMITAIRWRLIVVMVGNTTLLIRKGLSGARMTGCGIPIMGSPRRIRMLTDPRASNIMLGRFCWVIMTGTIPRWLNVLRLIRVSGMRPAPRRVRIVVRPLRRSMTSKPLKRETVRNCNSTPPTSPTENSQKKSRAPLARWFLSETENRRRRGCLRNGQRSNRRHRQGGAV